MMRVIVGFARVAVPCTVTEREPPVPPPLAMRSLSPSTMRTWSCGIPVASNTRHAFMAHAVRLGAEHEASARRLHPARGVSRPGRRGSPRYRPRRRCRAPALDFSPAVRHSPPSAWRRFQKAGEIADRLTLQRGGGEVADHVLHEQGNRVEPKDPCGVIHHPLDRQDRLGPASAR